MRQVGRSGIQLKVKRMFDLGVSAAGLAFLSPVWLAVALLVRLTSKGPVFFVQERPGYRGKLFRILKFRTMAEGSENMVKGQEVMKNDARITPVGKFLRRSKLDEMPQLINVLKGDMSLVGPRPERVASLEDYDAEIEKRLDMLPGMTGLAQVSGNIYLSLQERYRRDIYYVEHFSLGLDVWILLRTIGVIFLGEEKFKREDFGRVSGGRKAEI